MERTEYPEFCTLIYGLASVYRHDGGKMLELYFQALKRLSVAEIESAIKQWLQDEKKCAYLPKPGDLLAYFREDKTTQTAVQICVECKELPSEMTNAGKPLCMDCYHIHFWRPRDEYEIKFLNPKCRSVWEKRLKDRILPG